MTRARRGVDLTRQESRASILTDRSRFDCAEARPVGPTGVRMTTAQGTKAPAGVAAGLLDAQTLAANFGDLHPPLSQHEALVEADRCYFCYDAPCQQACPPSLDMPLLLRDAAPAHRLGARARGAVAMPHGLCERALVVACVEARDKPAGLNEDGIAAYKTPDDFAQK